MKKYVISKNDSIKIKGIAISLMIIHHFFTFPEWHIIEYSKGISTFAKYMCEPTKICAAIFAFITGWAYALNKNVTLRKSVEKIIKFLLNYWVVYVCCLTIACIYCFYKPSPIDIVLELFGLKNPIMCFCWYVYFYIISILILIKLIKIWNKNIIWAIFTGIVLPVVICLILGKTIHNEIINSVLYNFEKWFPCISMGYIFNYYNIFGKIECFLKWDKISNKIKIVYIMMIFIVCGIGGFLANEFIFLYGTFSVFSFVKLFEFTTIKNLTYLNKILSCLGIASTNMWFIHSIFFSSITRERIQPLIYWPKSPFLIFIWGMVVLYLGACCFNVIINFIQQRVDKWFKIGYGKGEI